MRRPITAVLLTVALAAFPSVAVAKTFHGKTSQGRSASLTTGADGVPRASTCTGRPPCKRAASGRRRTG